MIKGPNHLFYKERLRELGPVSLEMKRLREDSVNVYKYLKQRVSGARSKVLAVSSNDTRGKEQKVMHGKFHVNTRKNCKGDCALVQAAPRGWWNLHHRRHSRTTCTQSCAMRSGLTSGPAAVPSSQPRSCGSVPPLSPPPAALTSPPVLLREPLPGLQPGAVRAVGRQVRGADEAGAALGLQHHLQLGEALLVALPPLVVQRAAAHHVAGGGLADLPLGVALSARGVWLPLVRQVPQDGQVALLAGHRAAGAREPPPRPQSRAEAAEEPPGAREGGSGSAPGGGSRARGGTGVSRPAAAGGREKLGQQRRRKDKMAAAQAEVR